MVTKQNDCSSRHLYTASSTRRGRIVFQSTNVSAYMGKGSQITRSPTNNSRLTWNSTYGFQKTELFSSEKPNAGCDIWLLGVTNQTPFNRLVSACGLRRFDDLEINCKR